VHPALTLLIYALAVARGTVLVTEDRITEAPRTWALDKLNDRHWREFRRLAKVEMERIEREPYTTPSPEWEAALGEAGRQAEDRKGKSYLEYLLTCPWCVSVWLALPAVIVWWIWPTEPWSLGPAVLLAFSMITGKLSQIGG
jgi:hypothetical protein